MPENVKNYLTLERFSLRNFYYAFLDTSDYLADGLFIKHQVTVKFLQEYAMMTHRISSSSAASENAMSRLFSTH